MRDNLLKRDSRRSSLGFVRHRSGRGLLNGLLLDNLNPPLADAREQLIFLCLHSCVHILIEFIHHLKKKKKKKKKKQEESKDKNTKKAQSLQTYFSPPFVWPEERNEKARDLGSDGPKFEDQQVH